MQLVDLADFLGALIMTVLVHGMRSKRAVSLIHVRNALHHVMMCARLCMGLGSASSSREVAEDYSGTELTC